MTMHHAHRIGGERIGGDVAMKRYNPSDLSDLVATTPQCDENLLDQAIAAAADAQPGWAAASPEMRSDILDRAGAILMARADEVGSLLAREEGKTKAEGRGEVVRAARILRFFGGEALRLHGRVLPSVRLGMEVSTVPEPVGVVGLITPWNFPIAIPAWKAAPALAFGNAVVLKPAGIVPSLAATLVDVLEEAGMPPGVLNLVFAPGRVAGCLASHRDVAAVSFTGSTGVGRSLAVTAARNGKRFQAEMGGKNPLVVLDDADLDRAVKIALDGCFFSSGQRCTGSSRLIVTDAIHDRFVAELGRQASALRVGDACDPDTQIGPVASEEQRETIERYIAIARDDGGRIVTGGMRVSCATEGYFLAPTLIAGTDNAMKVNREEIFGPVASVIRAADFAEAMAIANDCEFGLSAGIVTRSLHHATEFRKQIRAGMAMVNAPTAGVDYHVPFGGTKGSSMGPREQGFAAHEFYTRTKTSYVAH